MDKLLSTRRFQTTKVNGVLYGESPVEYGMPQGPYWDPLLFVVFINDMPEDIVNWHINLYADDTAITVTGFSRQEIEDQLCEKLMQAKQWMDTNVLTHQIWPKPNPWYLVQGTPHLSLKVYICHT